MEDTLANLLMEEPKEDKDGYITYYTKALDNVSDGIVIYFDKGKQRFTDDGWTLGDVGLICMNPNRNKDQYEMFLQLCNSVAKHHFCELDGEEIVCAKNTNRYRDELVSIIQTITSIYTLMDFSKRWQHKLDRINDDNK